MLNKRISFVCLSLLLTSCVDALKKKINILTKKHAEAPAWNDKHFQTKADGGVNRTWQILAKKLNLTINDPVSEDEKYQVVAELMKWQGDNNEIADGQYGIKCAKKLESVNFQLKCDTDALLHQRRNNILSFLTNSEKKDNKYISRHALYLAEFMTFSDGYDKERREGTLNTSQNEQIPYNLIKRMILDDIATHNRDNLGLLALWLGTAQWGVKDFSGEKDPVKKNWNGPESNKGKRVREYEQGGVGIADYDVAALARFYEKFGTPDALDMNHSKYVNKKAKNKNETNKKQTKYDYSSKAYDNIKSNHEWYTYISKLFDQNNGGTPGDEWNDMASIWVMQDWLENNWNSAEIKQYADIGTQSVASRIKNSGNVPLDEKDDVNSLTQKYGDYGASRKDRTRQDYLNRLKYTERLTVLYNHVNKSYQKGERVSDDGMSIVHTSNQNTNSVQSN